MAGAGEAVEGIGGITAINFLKTSLRNVFSERLRKESYFLDVCNRVNKIVSESSQLCFWKYLKMTLRDDAFSWPKFFLFPQFKSAI